MKGRLLLEEWIIGVMICIMVVMVAVQVLSRYFLHRSLSYTEEIVRYGFVWITFLGASAAAHRNRHLSITGIAQLFPEPIRLLIKALSLMTGLIFCLVLTITGIGVTILQYRTDQTTAALGMPMWIVGCIIPISAVLTGIRLCEHALRSTEEE